MADPLVNMAPSPPGTPLPDAFVTLITSSAYLPGALALLHALHELHPAPRNFKVVCLVTPETVDARSIGALRNAGYDLVIGVEPIASGTKGRSGLHLMGRPDLDLALTKLHIFRLGSMFNTILYMDADTLPIRPLSHLFGSTAPHILSACPDVGWPDCFNSGVMVIRPRLSDFENLRQLMVTDEGGGNGSFDGADQGLLNQYFSEDGAGGPWNRLSFIYNVTPSAAYQYMPAFQRFAHKISVIHFIGPRKPWGRLSSRPAGLGITSDPASPMGYERLIDRWFDVYDRNVRPTAVHDPNLAKRFTVPENVAVWNRPLDDSDTSPIVPHDHSRLAALATGQYTSLPLDGRLDLMMPQPEPEPEIKAEAQMNRHEQSHSHTSTDSGGVVSSDQAAHARPHDFHQAAHDHRPAYHDHLQAHHGHHHSRHSPAAQPEAYAAAAWDGSRQAPPKDSRPEMEMSVSNVYTPAWDEPTKSQATYYHERHDDFSHPSLPTNVLKNDWYGHFTSTVPDPSKVTSVFPWEQSRRSRAQPSRKFPQERKQSPMAAPKVAIPPASLPSEDGPSVPAATTPPTATPPKPHPNFGESIAAYTNAWDMDSSIGRYAKRLTDLGIARQSSGMYTVPPSPARHSSRPLPPASRGNDISAASQGYERESYLDKCIQTERPSQSDAIVQVSPEMSPTSETPTSLRASPKPRMVDASTQPQYAHQLPPVKAKRLARGRVWDPQTDIDVMRRHQGLSGFTS